MGFDISEYIKKFHQKEQEELAKELATLLRLEYLNLDFYPIQTSAISLLDEKTAKSANLAVIDQKGKTLIIAVLDPQNKKTKKIIDEFKKQGYQVKLAVVSKRSLSKAWTHYKFVKKKKRKITATIEIQPDLVNEIFEKITSVQELPDYFQKFEKDSPYYLVEITLASVLKFDASDIHFEPEEDKVRVRLRIDGILVDVGEIEKHTYPVIKNRLKLFAGLLLNITDKPQDGRFTIVFKNEKIEVRVSAIPGAYGETLVLRILNPKLIKIPLEKLGIREDDYQILLAEIKKPNGLMLNTGPTGSGKTTTLYAILNKINSPKIKIITIEDPIEYHLEGISQTQVNERRGYTFAKGLRAILRQDPDVILVGEIRDKETANTAINAALTGHLVISTLHTNNSLGAIPRLIDLKVDPVLIPPALNLVIAQRLVRKVCPKCAELISPDEKVKKKIKKNLNNLPPRAKEFLEKEKIDLENFKILIPKGCSFCHFSGYKGRIGIFEFLPITPSVKELIIKNPSEEEILKSAEEFVSLQQDGLIKVLQKITTLEEVERITGPLK